MFLDESWHISWSMWIAEGKEWDSPWLFGKGVNIFVNALLFRGRASGTWPRTRLVTVLFGALTLAALFAAARRLYDDRTALVSALLYLFSPYALFYDRLVLTDPVQSTFATLALLWCVRTAQQARARDGAVLGLMLALSVFAKASGMLAFLTPVLAWLLLSGERARSARAFAVAYAIGIALVAWPLKVFFATTSTVRAAVDKSQEGPFGRVLENAPAGMGVGRGLLDAAGALARRDWPGTRARHPLARGPASLEPDRAPARRLPRGLVAVVPALSRVPDSPARDPRGRGVRAGRTQRTRAGMGRRGRSRARAAARAALRCVPVTDPARRRCPRSSASSS
jgi:hypothetical protein